MTTIDAASVITLTSPGVYDLPDFVYHADPVPGGSLSATGARKLLPPSCPALFRHWADNPQPPNADFDFGHAAHRNVLGAGPEIVIVDRERWDTKAVKEEVAAIRAAGKVPLKPDDAAAVEAMATALRAHPIASTLLTGGQPEQSLFWTDQATGVWRRARLDWLPYPRNGRMLVVDYKSAKTASPALLDRSIFDYGYHLQGATYLDAVLSLGLADDAAFLLIFQEKTPPYLVTVVEPDAMALRIGRAANRQACEIFRDCTAAGVWPGYSDEVELIGVPRWAEHRFLEENL